MHKQSATTNCITKNKPNPSNVERVQAWSKQFSSSIFTYLVNLKRRREDRAAFRQMIDLDENMLWDIGVTREDVIWANNLPLTENASQRLRDKSQARRRKQ